MFGQPVQQQQQQQPNTINFRFSYISENNANYKTITFSNQFRGKSLEELHLADLMAGYAPAQQPAAAPAPGGGLFGAAPAAPAAGGGLFGAPAAPAAGGGLFGAAPAAPAAGGGLFGAAPAAPAAGGGLFGNAAAPAAGGGLFGTSSAAPAAGGGLFGTNPAAPAAGGGLFGAAPAAPATGGGLFGTNAAAPAAGGGLFGASAAPAAGGGLFGAAPAAPAAGGGLFGAAAAPAPAGGGLFGTNPAAPAAGGGLFGASAAPAAGGGLFGAAAPAPAAGGGLFGTNPAAPAAGGGLFGTNPAAPAAAPAAGGGLFGAPAAAPVVQVVNTASKISDAPYKIVTTPISLPKVSEGPSSSLEGLKSQDGKPQQQQQSSSSNAGSASMAKMLDQNDRGSHEGKSVLSMSTSFVLRKPHEMAPKNIICQSPRENSAKSEKGEGEEGRDTLGQYAKSPVISDMPHIDQYIFESFIHAQPVKVPEGVSTEPSISELSNMKSDDLKKVGNFRIFREGVGSVAFKAPVDLSGLDLSEVFEFPREGVVKVKSFPKGLDAPCTVVIQNCCPEGLSENEVEKMKMRSITLGKRMGATNENIFDPQKRTLTLELDSLNSMNSSRK